jgi:HSP20 family protein
VRWRLGRLGLDDAAVSRLRDHCSHPLPLSILSGASRLRAAEAGVSSSQVTPEDPGAREAEMTLYFDPFRELDQLTQQIISGGRSPRSFPMDAYRRGDEFFVHLDLPGADPSSIDVTVERNALTVRAERRFEFREGDELLVSERPQGIFSRQLSLGATIDTDSIGASYEDGVLTLTLAVSEAAKPRKVEVRASGDRTTIEPGAS